MGIVSNVTRSSTVTLTSPGDRFAGLMLGLLGVLAFSFSLPATELAVRDIDPRVVAFGRAVVAGLLAIVVLRLTHAPRPTLAQWRRLTIVGGGVVVGFPLFTSIALTTSEASHGAVVIALLPAATALAAVARAGERPRRAFWVAAAAGLAMVLAFVLAESSGSLNASDGMLLLATAAGAVGYAEGGTLARDLGGAATICCSRLRTGSRGARRLRLCVSGVDVPRLLRLVRRARPRRRRPGWSGPAPPAPAHVETPSA